LGITAEDVVKLFEADVRARRRLAELLVSEPDVRLAIINAVLRDVATKADIAELREEIEKARAAEREDMERLRGEFEAFRREVFTQIGELRERVAKLEGAFTQLVERVGDLDRRIDSLDKRIDALDRRIDALDKRIDSLDRRIDALDKRIDYVTKVSWVLTISVIATLVAQVLARIFTP
jgi:chromosome segregation ATPase